MPAVTISPKFQVVIPKEIREFAHLKPGQKLEVMVSQDQITFVPVRDIRELRGKYKGLDTTIPEERERY